MRAFAEPLLLHTLIQTAGRTIADSLAMQLDKQELSRFRAALHSVAYCCDAALMNPAAMPPADFAMGGTIADNILAGDAFVIFSDANPKRGYSAAHVSICKIEDAFAAGAGRPQLARANALARRISQSIHADLLEEQERKDRDPAEQHSHLIQLAALLIDGEMLRRLKEITGGVPVLAIIGDSRPVGITSGCFFKSVTRLPGLWLGTSTPAGHC